jgi:aromatic ring hydroxylase
MTRSGDEYVRGLRDGRTVLLNGERVADVTMHPAFAAGIVPLRSSTILPAIRPTAS